MTTATPADRPVAVLVGTVVVGYALLAWAAIAPGLNLVGGLLGLVLALGVAVVQLGWVSRPGVRRTREGTAVVLLALACLVVVPVVAVSVGWIAFAAFLAAGLRLLLPPRAGLAGFAAVVVAVGLVAWFAGSASVLGVLTAALGTVVTGLVIEGLSRWWALVATPGVVPVGALTAGTAPDEELVASPVVGPADEPVAGPVAGPVAESADDAGSEVEPVVRSAVAREIAAARPDLELAVLGEDVELPEAVDALFADLVGVAVGHARRHPAATSCHVTIARRGAEARIVVTHDGATDDPRPEDFEALGERFDEADGSVLAERDDEQFTVEGRLPLGAASETSETDGADAEDVEDAADAAEDRAPGPDRAP